MRYGDSLDSLSLESLHSGGGGGGGGRGDFPVKSSTWQVEVTSRSSHTPVCTEHAQFVDVS